MFVSVINERKPYNLNTGLIYSISKKKNDYEKAGVNKEMGIYIGMHTCYTRHVFEIVAFQKYLNKSRKNEFWGVYPQF